jgi:aminopeptidase
MNGRTLKDRTLRRNRIAPVPRVPFSVRLDRLAQVAVKVGLRPAPGQQVILSAPIEALSLVRLITEYAYKAGASLVTTLFDQDDECARARYRFASEDTFDTATDWLHDGVAAALNKNVARLKIEGSNPSLLAGQDSSRVARAAAANDKAYKPVIVPLISAAINWSIVPFATKAWAKTVFPDLSEDEAVARLWDALFAMTLCDQEDPIAAWAAHNANLKAKVKLLNEKRYHALRFTGPGTDLTVGLADDHEWCGGTTLAKNGITGNANIPTFEVFTCPHRDRVDGWVSSTKPLCLRGNLVEGIRVRFEGGRIVEATASKGENLLKDLLATDDGSCRAGEVALVLHSSPISKSGLLFYNTLSDENAACHIAVGVSYSKCILNGRNMTPAERFAKGANQSSIHVDWMIGSAFINVDGITADGAVEPLMRNGEWV